MGPAVRLLSESWRAHGVIKGKRNLWSGKYGSHPINTHLVSYLRSLLFKLIAKNRGLLELQMNELEMMETMWKSE